MVTDVHSEPIVDADGTALASRSHGTSGSSKETNNNAETETQNGEEKEGELMQEEEKRKTKVNAAKSPKNVMAVGERSFDGETKDSTEVDKSDGTKASTRTSPRKKASPRLDSSDAPVAGKSPADTSEESETTQGRRTSARRASKTAAIRSLFGEESEAEDTSLDKPTSSPTKKSPPSSKKKPNKSIPEAKATTSSKKEGKGLPSGIGTWNDKECKQFLTGVAVYGWGSWKKIQAHVPTRNRTQVKSHAQKFDKHYPEKVKKMIKDFEAEQKSGKISRGTKRQVKAEKDKKQADASPTAKSKTKKRAETAKKSAAPPSASTGVSPKKRVQESKINATEAPPSKRAKWGLRANPTPSEVKQPDKEPKVPEPQKKSVASIILQHPQKRPPSVSARKRTQNVITKSRYKAASSNAILEPAAKKGKGVSETNEVTGKGTKPCNGKWISEEQKQFQEACIKHGWGKWINMLTDIPTRNKDQIKTHAQKFKRDHPEETERLKMEHDWLIQQEKMNWSPPSSPARKPAIESDDEEISEPHATGTIGKQGILKQGSIRSSRRATPKHVLIMDPPDSPVHTPGSPEKPMKPNNDTPSIRSPCRTTVADLGAAEAIMALNTRTTWGQTDKKELNTKSLPASEGAEGHDLEEKPEANTVTQSREVPETKGTLHYYNNFLAATAPAQAAPMLRLPTAAEPNNAANQNIKNGYIVQWSKMSLDQVKLLDYCKRLNAEGENMDTSPADAVRLRQRLLIWLDSKYPFEPFPSLQLLKQKSEKAGKAEVDATEFVEDAMRVKASKWEKDKETIRNGYLVQWDKMEHKSLWDYCKRLNAEGETIAISDAQATKLRNRLQNWLDGKYPLAWGDGWLSELSWVSQQKSNLTSDEEHRPKSNEDAKVASFPTAKGEARTVKSAPPKKKIYNNLKQPPPHWLATASWDECMNNIHKWNSDLSLEEQADEVKKYKSFTSKQKEQMRIKLVTLMGNRDLQK